MSEAMTLNWWGSQSQMIVDDLGIILVTLDHQDLVEPIRCASLDMDVTSRGLLFFGWPMQVKLPSASSGVKRAAITIQNIDPEISETIRLLKGQISVLFEYVSRETPDDLLWDHGGLFFKSVDNPDAAITAELVGYGSEAQSWPKTRATPDRTPGLFVL
jgi:hypothetical protein